MNTLREWAYTSGRDRGWDAADWELVSKVPVPEQKDVKIPRAYAGEQVTIDEFRRGWLFGLGLRRNGFGVDGKPLNLTDQSGKGSA